MNKYLRCIICGAVLPIILAESTPHICDKCYLERRSSPESHACHDFGYPWQAGPGNIMDASLSSSQPTGPTNFE